jgi:glycosyltransferase involved in cell wall biosynthesis
VPSPFDILSGRAVDRALDGAVCPSFIGIVLPANNEERHIRHSVLAIKRSLAHAALEQIHIELVVVADSSSDATADLAQLALGSRGHVVEVHHQNAGAARRAGFDRLMLASEGLGEEDVWFATTDADSLVPTDWLLRQLRWWRRGADAVAGTVAPFSWEEQPPRVRRRYVSHVAALGTGNGHPHVHGANLAMTKDTYRAAGGMPAIATGEDHALWDAARAAGRRAVHVGDVIVETSARREGRAQGGFADLLRSLG